jgi:hypothetical protein
MKKTRAGFLTGNIIIGGESQIKLLGVVAATMIRKKTEKFFKNHQ